MTMRAMKRQRDNLEGVPSDSKWARRISVEDDDSGESDCSAPSPSLWLVDEATDPLLRNGAYHHLETVPKAETIRRRRRLLGPNCPVFFADNPLKIVRGHMQYLYQENGTAVLDCINNVCHVGHCHPDVVLAGQRQMGALNTNSRYLHDAVLDYADDLLTTFPSKLTRMFFVNSGTEANELALWLARVYTKQEDVIALKGGYHGHSKLLIEVGSHKHDQPGGGGPGAFCHVVPSPDVYRGQFKDKDTAGVQYAGTVKDVIDELQQKGKGICAFLAESVPSCGGQIIPPRGYFENVYKHVRDVGGVCIADEVQVGFGRVGSHFWGFEVQGVVPDIVTIGKPMGNGHPVAAVVTTEKIAQAFASRGVSYFNTYGGNPVSATIAQAVLDVIRRENLQEHAHKLGKYLLGELRKLKEKHQLIGDVRGVGLMVGIELVTDRETLEPARKEASAVVSEMKSRNILLSVEGPLENVLKFKPPMCFSEENADLLVSSLDEVLSEFEGK
ncbi:5-phosphohydroxy-L-lysine phospho-lyase-like isoform X2 [Oscarella lobularis]|uniref:5-phosphohydroxy-L-lysine phospho-lyase-like isoform X2 n=1 Tax=Oscarella lobularis TaxID=121494 RepID=UPI0033140487